MKWFSLPIRLGIVAACLMTAGCPPLFSPVPDMVGQTQDAAVAAITAAHLIAGKITQECSNTVDAGLVLKQNPPKGLRQATFMGSVTLVVSSGPCNVTVPDVTGQSQTATSSAITDAHLTPGAVSESYHGIGRVGLVISQNPSAGGETPYGSTVDLVVSLGPEPITGTIVINDNHPATNNPQVSLTLTWQGGGGSGVTRMRFSDDGEHWTEWEPVQGSRTHTLPGGDGYQTVRVQFSDSLDNRSPTLSDYIRLDTTPPTGSIEINRGDAATANPLVNLGLAATDPSGSGVTQMRFSDDGEHWTDWETLAESHAYTLPGTDGEHAVWVQYLDGAGNVSVEYSDAILLDTAPPTGAIHINNGDSLTGSASVTLRLTWSDGSGSGVTQMRFSDDGAHWTVWENVVETRTYTLPEVNGYHTVRVQYQDGVGNVSASYNDYIKLQMP